MPGLLLSCSVCGSTERKASATPAWATWSGFGGCAEILGVAAPGQIEVVEDRPPRVGEHVALRVHHPFRAEEDGEFWALYEPPLARYNGWDADTADELSALTLTRCGLTGARREVEHGAWLVSAAVRDAVPLEQIAARCPSSTQGEVPPIPCDARGLLATRSGALLHLQGSVQGDLGGWHVLHHAQGRWALVLSAVWATHEDSVWIGHRPLDAEALAGLVGTGATVTDLTTSPSNQ